MPILSRRDGALFAALTLANAAAWGWAFSAFGRRPGLLGMALLAWVFGLRHAADPDHIAAIDNVVRKLMHAGQRPVTTGLWFSMGHSTIVVLACTALAEGAARLQGDLGRWKDVGATIGTLVSAGFLLMIAAMNLGIARGVLVRLRRADGGMEAAPAPPPGGGVLARLFRPLLAVIGKPWHMYPLGFLFGLGFDTATEIGLLGLSAGQATAGLSLARTLIFPALFTAGMALVDTADSALMAGAYGWAFAEPVRKLWYNLTVTAASVAVALLIGGIEALTLLAERFGLKGGAWRGLSSLNDDLVDFGFVVIALFAVCWAASAALYRRAESRSRQIFPDRLLVDANDRA